MQKRSLDVAVISDLHLGTYGCHANEIANYLRSISPQVLILNGDIIDGWQFSKRYFPLSHIQVIKEIFNLMSEGTRIVYITGNHDEMLRRYTDMELEKFLLTDKLLIELNRKKTWIFHGDIFDVTTKGSAKILAKLGGKGYDMLILLNRAVNWALKLMNKEKMSFSKKIKNRVKKAVKWIADFEQIAAELAIEKKYDYIICGHIHQPQKRVIETKNGKVTYLNSGDWVENLTALEYSNHEWNIFKYDEKDFASVPKAAIHKKLPEFDVVTEEIRLFLNSLAV
jgi:UDP-2,3-diacylglucosamine pyrophosphatase LpxH